MQRFVSAIGLCALATTATAQLSLVIPAGYDTVLEDSANAFPYGSSVTAWPGLRIQHVYDSSHFTSQNVNAPVVITGLRWRAADTAGSWAGGTYSPATVSLSTAAVDYLATTTNYATNHGADLTQVFSGTVTVQPGVGNGTGVIGPWHVDVQFTTPFLYDPAAGDLCIDCDVALPGMGSFTSLASCSTAAPLPTLARRVYASSQYPNANGVDSNILVCEVQYAPGAGYAYSTPYGTGCYQPAITHAGSARPVIGTSISLDTNNLPVSALVGVTLFGLVEFNPGIDLTPLGMPGCNQYLSIDASQVWVPVNGSGSTNFPIPSDPAFAGVEIKTQGATLAPGVNALGALSTNGVKHVLDIN